MDTFKVENSYTVVGKYGEKPRVTFKSRDFWKFPPKSSNPGCIEYLSRTLGGSSSPVGILRIKKLGDQIEVGFSFDRLNPYAY